MVEVEISTSDFSGLLDMVRRGEEVCLLDHGLAVAKVIPVTTAQSEPRVLGRLEGQFRISDDFDAPLPDELLDLFEGDPAAVERDRRRAMRGREST